MYIIFFSLFFIYLLIYSVFFNSKFSFFFWFYIFHLLFIFFKRGEQHFEIFLKLFKHKPYNSNFELSSK